MQKHEHSDGSEEDMGQKTADAMVYSQLDCMVLRVCQEAYVKHSRVYCAYQLDTGAGAFKRVFVTHRNAVTTALKRTSRTSECDGREKEEMLKEDLERNMTLCLHKSFCSCKFYLVVNKG